MLDWKISSVALCLRGYSFFVDYEHELPRKFNSIATGFVFQNGTTPKPCGHAALHAA